MRLKICLVLALISLVAPESASALIMLDQSHFTAGSTPSAAVAEDRGQIQTFTVGKTGVLSEIDVKVKRAENTVEDLVMTLWSLDGGGNLADQLVVRSLPPSVLSAAFLSEFVAFDVFEEAIDVVINDMLAIELTSAAPNVIPFDERYLWDIKEDYAGGEALIRFNGNILTNAFDGDFHFKTYVDVAPAGVVPEPASVLLFTAGMTGIFARRRC